MVLVQVLGIVAVASAIAVIMISLQDRAIRQTLAARDRLQAEALALAGETSVLVAFRRDGEKNPYADHYGEAWYAVSQVPVNIGGGRFSVTIRDAQAKFNLNRLASGASDRVIFNRIASAAGLAAEAGDRISAGLAGGIELTVPDDLVAFGFTSEEIAALAPSVTVLPRWSELNLSTAEPELVRAVLANPATASEFIAGRESQNGADPAGGGTGILLPPGTGLVTRHLEVAIVVETGDATVRLTSLISREPGRDGYEARAVTRRWD